MFLIDSIIDFFTPDICYVCGKSLKKNEHFLCEKCLQSIEIAEIDNCINHQLPLKTKYFNHLFYYSLYRGTIKDAIHIFKYGSRPELSEVFARLLFYRINEMELLLYKYDYMLFIPMHPVKKRERGFNQSEELAKHLSDLTKIPLLKNGLKRIHNSISQTKITLDARLSNVNGNFRAEQEIDKIEEKNIVIIDDVITTGSTLNEVSKILLKYNPKNIDCLTLASAK